MTNREAAGLRFEEDRLNLLLDELRQRRSVADPSLESALIDIAHAVLTLGAVSSTPDIDVDHQHRLWDSLVTEAECRGAAPITGGVLSLPAMRPSIVRRWDSIWSVRLLSAVPAVLLIAVTASHYRDEPGRVATTTAQAIDGASGTEAQVATTATCLPTGVETGTLDARPDQEHRTVTPSSTSGVTADGACDSAWRGP